MVGRRVAYGNCAENMGTVTAPPFVALSSLARVSPLKVVDQTGSMCAEYFTWVGSLVRYTSHFQAASTFGDVATTEKPVEPSTEALFSVPAAPWKTGMVAMPTLPVTDDTLVSKFVTSYADSQFSMKAALPW